MPLTDTDKTALRAFWLGEPLADELALAVNEPHGDLPPGATEQQRRLHAERLALQDDARDFLKAMGAGLRRRLRRLVMVYSPPSVMAIAAQLHSEKPDEVRRAAVEILKLFDQAAKEEEADAEALRLRESESVVERLSDDQRKQLLAILADAGGAKMLTKEGA